ncbi:MAG: tRNA (N(6)-L-threonylcarbamoyladenosine(37)-C(2))-methylthiotransferase MtaB [Clostridia bacterium]|nr:tRNA (N(6)-L-threonylcarbamoyladenosine(37)-C(2))-methylthiotransferase MtaB [Clostridia bacterium]
MKKLRAAILTLGCRVNQYESDAIAARFEALGAVICPASEAADIYVINTCTVTAESDRKSRQFIRRCIKKNPAAVIAVTGCFAQVSSEVAAAIPGVDLVVGNDRKLSLAEKALQLAMDRNAEIERLDITDIFEAPFEDMTIEKPESRTRAFVKIEDGCESKCAYCIIPYARGNIRAKQAADVIREVEGIVRHGCKEVVLTGIETSSYGKDFDAPYDLADLLAEVNAVSGIERIRLGSLDPAAMTEAFIDRIASLEKLMPHFHISMQSGSNAVLGRMRRRYRAETALAQLEYLRERIPYVMFSTDLIVGFPGETDEEFEETMEFCRRAEFFHLHIFPYSKRRGTPAAEMPNQVAEDIKSRRLAALAAQQATIQEKLIQEQMSADPCASVLFEAWDDAYIYGHTENFMEVKAPRDPSLSGKIVSVRLTGYEKGICICKPMV